jgi:hypothetical protein
MQSSNLFAFLGAFAIASGAPLPAWEATHTAPVAVSEPGGNSEPMAGYLTPRNPTNEDSAGHRWAPYGEVENGKQA